MNRKAMVWTRCALATLRVPFLIRIRTSSQILLAVGRWSAECLAGSMQPQFSFPTLPHSEGTRTPSRRFDEELSRGFVPISVEVSIPADTRRLFHALTTPEYVESWISVPGEHPDCSTVASRNDQNYLIEHSCDGNPSVLISGRYLVCRRHNLVFSWRVDGDRNVPETKVDIRLRGDFERTKLILTHSGFVSRHDSAWHRTLWNASLKRLAALYGSTDRQGSVVVTRRDQTGRYFRRGSELAS